jgi:hypothetical protein
MTINRIATIGFIIMFCGIILMIWDVKYASEITETGCATWVIACLLITSGSEEEDEENEE